MQATTQQRIKDYRAGVLNASELTDAECDTIGCEIADRAEAHAAKVAEQTAPASDIQRHGHPRQHVKCYMAGHAPYYHTSTVESAQGPRPLFVTSCADPDCFRRRAS